MTQNIHYSLHKDKLINPIAPHILVLGEYDVYAYPAVELTEQTLRNSVQRYHVSIFNRSTQVYERVYNNPNLPLLGIPTLKDPIDLSCFKESNSKDLTQQMVSTKGLMHIIDRLGGTMERLERFNRAVVDEFKGMENEQIKNICQARSFPYAVLMENWVHELNVGAIVRTANGFGARKVFYLGQSRYNRRGAVGAYHYTDVIHLDTMDELKAMKKDYHFVGIDNIEGSKDLREYQWKENTLMLFGNETTGLSSHLLELCDELVEIPMFGSIRSFNASTAAGVLMYDFVAKWK